MIRFLRNKKGVTLLEGLIAMMLLALVTTGTFAVLLSTSRKTSQPDIREEMALAVDRASQMLQAYVYNANDTSTLSTTQQDRMNSGLCEGADSTPLSTLTAHDISCLLPPICDQGTVGHSSFVYYVEDTSLSLPSHTSDLATSDASALASGEREPLRTIRFEITCNGYTL